MSLQHKTERTTVRTLMKMPGALAGRLELGRIRETAPGDAAEAIPPRRNRYSRQTGLRARRQAAVPPPGPQ